ncbi:MAG: GNAT family N-acetyltransferase [Bacteroidaceae bacterium]|nr:GNAT family N-acetyltransferase [Bacteroidaceae bacterium]
MRLKKATIEDYEYIIAFYDDATDRTPDMERFARWKKGLHPTIDGIRVYIEEGSMYLYREKNVIVGAMAVTMYQGEDYHAIEWSQQVADDKVAVIHILAVSPDCQGKGIGSEMVREAINLAKENGIQTIRLDALASNTPAHRIYERLGFEYRGKQHLYAENTGWTDFYFFEYNDRTSVAKHVL